MVIANTNHNCILIPDEACVSLCACLFCIDFFFQLILNIYDIFFPPTSVMDMHDQTRQELLRTVGNTLHETVPVFKDEEHNQVVRTVGDSAANQTR